MTINFEYLMRIRVAGYYPLLKVGNVKTCELQNILRLLVNNGIK